MKYQIGDCSKWIGAYQILQLWLLGKSYFQIDAALECRWYKSNYKNRCSGNLLLLHQPCNQLSWSKFCTVGSDRMTIVYTETETKMMTMTVTKTETKTKTKTSEIHLLWSKLCAAWSHAYRAICFFWFQFNCVNKFTGLDSECLRWLHPSFFSFFIVGADDVDEDGDEEQKKDKVVDDEELLHW